MVTWRQVYDDGLFATEAHAQGALLMSYLMACDEIGDAEDCLASICADTGLTRAELGAWIARGAIPRRKG